MQSPKKKSFKMTSIVIVTILILAIAQNFQFIRGDLTKMSSKSHVENFEGASALFEALTASPNDGFNYDWQVFSYTVNSEEDNLMRNCTVLYLDQCTSWNKCRQTCQKTGAGSYRWFHDGCCECVGGNCINYGINESRCSQCPEPSCDIDDE